MQKCFISFKISFKYFIFYLSVGKLKPITSQWVKKPRLSHFTCARIIQTVLAFVHEFIWQDFETLTRQKHAISPSHTPERLSWVEHVTSRDNCLASIYSWEHIRPTHWETVHKQLTSTHQKSHGHKHWRTVTHWRRLRRQDSECNVRSWTGSQNGR